MAASFVCFALCRQPSRNAAMHGLIWTSAPSAGPRKDITLGSLDPNTGFKFLLELTSRGAAISKATLSEFDDRNYKNLQPLVLLSPAAKPDGSQVFSMENQALVLTDQQLQLRLDKLDWKSLDVTKDPERLGDGNVSKQS